MMNWGPTIVSLLVLTVIIQGFVFWWLQSPSARITDYALMDAQTREVASTLALVFFGLYTFCGAFFGRNNVWRFVDNLPFHPLHTFIKGILAVPAGRTDLVWLYSWIWTVLAFVVPCVVFVMINAAIGKSIWDRMRNSRFNVV